MDVVGRERELEHLTSRLRERRLVTLTGPGGIGKTALAREAASAVGPEFEYGAITVDLTRVDRPEGVAEAVAGQLGYADFESLMNSPSDQPALLVFDNCEHVLDAAAAVTARMLEACVMPTILATSRSPLDLPDEAVVPLGPLATPPPEMGDHDAPALRLFLARVRDHGVTLHDVDLAAAAEITRRLDGVPLALEIAASRLRSLSVPELLGELEARPHALARPRFRGKPSHRSVAEMVGWSSDLLDDEGREFFRTLGVFAGPFTASMANAVAAPVGSDPASARPLLDELVAASLVVADTGGDTTWYRLLHPVRAVALDQLHSAGGLPAAESRLVDHVVELAVDVISRTRGGWDGPALHDLLALYDNLAASLRWSLDHDDEPNRALVLLAVLWGVVHQAHTAEVHAIGEAVLDRWPDPATPGWADAAATVATCRNLVGDPAAAIELADRTLPHVGSSPHAPATLRRVLAQAHRACGRLEDSREWFAAGAAAGVEHGAAGMAMELLVDFGLVAAELGDRGAGLDAIDRARRQAVEHGARINAAWALAGRGAVVLGDDPAGAVPILEEALAEADAVGYPAGKTFALRALAVAHLDLGDDAAAAQTLLSLLDELLGRGGLNDLRMVLDTAAMLLERAGNAGWADLAATAASLPITSVSTPVHREVFDRARAGGRVLTTREAYVACRWGLREIVDPTVGPPPPAPEVRSLIREGDHWRLSYDGKVISLKASKGMDDLATLLREPGREIACLALMGVSTDVADRGHEVIDATARRAYEERVRELQADIDEAEAANDLGRADQARVELDALVDQLTAALGIGGRGRKTGDDAERARSAVTQRLRATLKRIAEHHGSLGAHLEASVTTGTFCCYAPDPPVVWRVAG